MDDADRATDLEEAAWADLERRIAAARGEEAKQVTRRYTRCLNCGETLASHRQPAGTCLDCQERSEWAARLRAGRMGVGGL